MMDNKMPCIGSVFSWKELSGREYTGIVTEIDSNVVFVTLEDGSIKAVEL